MGLTLDCGYPRLTKSRGGRVEQDGLVDYLPGDRNGEDSLSHLVGTRRMTRRVATEGRAGDVDEEGAGGGEGGCGSQTTSLGLVDLDGLKLLSRWCEL